MKFKKVSVIIGVVFLTISIATFSLYQNTNTKRNMHILGTQTKQGASSKNSNNQPEAIPTGTGDQNNPATWSRYTYNYDFRIAYPPYWNVVLDQDGNGVSFMTTGFHQDDDFSMPYGNSNEVVYSIFGQNDTSDLKLKDGDQFPSDTTSETMVVTHLKQVRIDGFSAVEFDYYPTDNVNFLRTRIAVLKGSKMYRFTATYAQDAGKQSFEEMMQSLRFI